MRGVPQVRCATATRPINRLGVTGAALAPIAFANEVRKHPASELNMQTLFFYHLNPLCVFLMMSNAPTGRKSLEPVAARSLQLYSTGGPETRFANGF